jgi:hypothetical protein
VSLLLSGKGQPGIRVGGPLVQMVYIQHLHTTQVTFQNPFSFHEDPKEAFQKKSGIPVKRGKKS